jgi:hypothetical protein
MFCERRNDETLARVDYLLFDTQTAHTKVIENDCMLKHNISDSKINEPI